MYKAPLLQRYCLKHFSRTRFKLDAVYTHAMQICVLRYSFEAMRNAVDEVDEMDPRIFCLTRLKSTMKFRIPMRLDLR